MGYREEVLRDRPIGFWRFDEMVGTVSRDLTNGAHDATYNQGYTLGSLGPSIGVRTNGTRLEGSGTATPGSIGIPNAAVASVLTGDHSIELWMTLEVARSGYQVWSEANSSGWTNPIALAMPSTTIRLYWGAGTSNETQLLDTTVTLSLNQWIQIVTTASSTTARLYVNGVQISTTTSGQTRSDVGNTFRVGTRQENTTGTGAQRGNYADLSIYNYALSPARILSHYRAQKGQTGSSNDRRRGRVA